jgi:murein L,D-transpeptidase YcbB/YkuD
MYVTAMVTESGEVHFLRDIYGEDRTLEGEPPTENGEDE